MILGKRVLCLVTARSGSKGLKNKNILKLGRHPLLAWPISAARKSKFVDDIIVSTDCEKIARIARKYKAEIPFLRPKYLARDTSLSIDVILYNIKRLDKDFNRKYDYIVLLEPTSPFTSTKDIDTSLKLLISNSKKFAALVSVTTTEKYHPSYALSLNKNMRLSNVGKTISNHTRRQELKSVYFPDGSIYISRISNLTDKKSFYHNQTIGIELPKWKAIEIDNLFDFNYAQSIVKNNSNILK